ncbi:MAG: TIM-barrel domain-containing protein [Candidatus Binatia bacterium]
MLRESLVARCSAQRRRTIRDRRYALRALLTAAALLAATGAPATTLVDTDLGATVTLVTPELTVTVQKSPFAITVDDAGGTLLAEAPGVAQGALAYWRGPTQYLVTQTTAAPLRSGDRVSFDVETSEGLNAAVSIEFRNDAAFFVDLAPSTPATVTEARDTFVAPLGERYYGLTERIVSDGLLGSASELSPQAVGGLDRRGELVPISVAATIAIYTPFLHSSRGYGLFVDGPMQGSVDVANAQPDRLAIRFNFEPSAQVFRWHLFRGPGHAAILDQYTALTGRPWLPPRWAYKHMRWRDEHASGPTTVLDGVPMNAALVEDVMMYESLGFPSPGWYNFDRPWSSGVAGSCPGGGFARFAFDPVRFPNAPQMIAALAARGTRTVVFNAPWACGNPADPLDNAYDAALNGYLAPNEPAHIDFTNPAAVAWWQGKIAAFVTGMDIAGFKLDRGDETVPSLATDIYFDGRNGLQLHNDYPRLYVKTYHDALQAARPDDWITKTRPGYAGSQAYGLYWGGDITGANFFGTGAGTDLGLRSALISLQRLAFMGFPNWGTDTGGYYQFKQRDVFARWLQFSAFTPVMEIGGGLRIGDAINGPHAPWAMPTAPTVDAEMIDIYRYYTWLHHELVPYAYSEGIRANATGHPIATPLVFEYPDDPAVGDLWDQYLYGPWLLAAPLWQNGARTRDVYLPAAAWTDYWNDSQLLTGPLTLTAVDAPLGRLPLYVRLGAIIPMEVVNGVTGHGSAGSDGTLTLDVYPHQSSSYDLREARGTVTTTFSSSKLGAYDESATTTVTTGAATRSYRLRVKTNFRPASVTRDATPLAECADQAAFDDPIGTCGWLYALGGRATARFATVAAGATLVFEPGDPLLCGNGVLDAGEECDDGNAIAADACSDRCLIVPRDDFKCYAAKALDKMLFARPTVAIDDPFLDAARDTIKPTLLCNPADAGRAVLDPTAHLTCYKLKKPAGAPAFAARQVTVANRFGVTSMRLTKPASLCAPSELDGQASALNLDHYTCYKAKLDGGTFARTDLPIADAFESKTSRLLKPLLVCAAADLDGGGVLAARAALACYKIKDAPGAPSFTARDVAVDNPLDTESLHLTKGRLLCLSSSVGEVP